WRNVRNNNVMVPVKLECASGLQNLCTDYLAPASQTLSKLQKQNPEFVADFPKLTLVDPGLRSGYTQSYFLGVQKRISEAWDAEIDTLGALGRKLITSDVVNRGRSTLLGRYNNDLDMGDIVWRSNQGLSDYNALTAAARYR